ncbi:MAG: hypothetical protein ACSHWU_12820, partial [Marinicella sp.]
MKQLLAITMGLAATVFTTAQAQPFSNLDTQLVETSIKQLHKQDGWYAYSVPAADDTASMCCFNQGEQTVCDLNEASFGYGSSNKSPDTETIHVFVHVDDGQV